MLQVGLTGGIGAGKSTATARLAALGAVVIDADVLAREAVAPGTAGLAAVVRAFGAEVLAPDGSLDRAALAARVFADPAARQRLEAIVHPEVARRRAELVAAAPGDAVVVHDIPLLVEMGLTAGLDLVVVVDAAQEVRLRRLVEGRGLDEEQARSRIAAQAERAERLAIADVVLDGGGAVSQLQAQVDRLWERLWRQAASAHS